MTINALTALVGSNQQGVQKSNNKIQTAIASLVSGKRVNDVADLSVATQLQAQTSALKQASGNIIQALSLSQVADGGAQQIQDALIALRDLAQKASSPTLNADNRKALNEQFQELKSSIDRIAKSTSFNNQNLLDGSLSGSRAISVDGLLSGAESSDDSALSITSLLASDVLSGDVNLLSVDAAQTAFNTVGEAIGRVTTARASIGSFQRSLDYASGSLDSALANQLAAQSVLQDTDFADAASQAAQGRTQLDAALALAAQGNRLSPALLQLVG